VTRDFVDDFKWFRPDDVNEFIAIEGASSPSRLTSLKNSPSPAAPLTPPPAAAAAEAAPPSAVTKALSAALARSGFWPPPRVQLVMRVFARVQSPPVGAV
jgi:hypothetical protein